ncbi:MAG: DUF1449 family protein [Ferruginibacter sp.]|nr:DUF1449 family protein [Cytophagales bacterium]
MKDLLELAFSPIHFPLTLLLLAILLYWLTVIVGLLDLSTLDFDVNADGHLDKNIHVDLKTRRNGLIWLSFFHLGKVPFMVFLSFLVLFLWSGSILGNYYLGNQSVAVAGLLFIPNLVIGLLLTKFATFPLIRVFSDGKNEFETNRDVIGRTCVVLLSATNQKVGQAEVTSASGAPLLLTVRTTEDSPIRRGEKGLVIDYDDASHTYLIEPFDP